MSNKAAQSIEINQKSRFWPQRLKIVATTINRDLPPGILEARTCRQDGISVQKPVGPPKLHLIAFYIIITSQFHFVHPLCNTFLDIFHFVK